MKLSWKFNCESHSNYFYPWELIWIVLVNFAVTLARCWMLDIPLRELKKQKLLSFTDETSIGSFKTKQNFINDKCLATLGSHTRYMKTWQKKNSWRKGKDTYDCYYRVTCCISLESLVINRYICIYIFWKGECQEEESNLKEKERMLKIWPSSYVRPSLWQCCATFMYILLCIFMQT